MVHAFAILLPLVGSIFSLSQTAWAAPSPSMGSLATIVTYPLPSIYKNSTHFRVRANMVDIPVVAYQQYDYAHFSMEDKPAMIAIKVPEGNDINDIRISPKRLKIEMMKRKDTLYFKIPKSSYFIVKIRGHKELIIAADPLEYNKPLDKGDGIYNVKDDRYKADSEGKKLTTEAFQKAIDDASKAWEEAKKKDPKKDPNRGTVYVPKGIYTVGNLVLKSNVALYLEGGAVMRFSGKPEDYTNHWLTESRNSSVTWWIRTEFNSTNIKVHGRGTLDGIGNDASHYGKINNNILVAISTKNFEAEGLILRESASWSVIAMRSSDVKFHHLKLLNRLDMPENDCIDIIDSQRVNVSETIGISLDNPFSTKTYTKIFPKYSDKLPAPQMLENVIFNNVISWTRSFGLKIGQGAYMKQGHIAFTNSVVYDAAIGFGIDHRHGTSTISDVKFENIDVERLSLPLEKRNTWIAILITDPKDPEHDGAGVIERVKVKGIKVYDKGKTNGILEGFSDKASINKIYFEGIRMPGLRDPGTTLKELDIQMPKFVNDIRIKEEEVAV